MAGNKTLPHPPMTNDNFGLDPEQLIAVNANSARVLVIAPPGSGKTSVLTHRYARLIGEGAPPSSLLAITFTNRAAREMRSRIQQLTRLDACTLNIGTFHSFALKLIKKANPSFGLISRAQSVRLLKELGAKDASRLANSISRMKNLSTDAGGDDAIFGAYCQRLKELNSFDLDDLITEAVRLLQEYKTLACFSNVLVDEFQDINPSQARLVRLLSEGSSILAIGDPDQAIYSFRGSSVESFINFEKEYPGTEVIRLNKNYRCSARIVEASQSVIRNNGVRLDNASSSVKTGGVLKVVECPDERGEARFIVSEIERLMGGLDSRTVKGNASASFSDFAVLYRTNRQAEALKEAFAASSVPFKVMGASTHKLDDFLSYLKSVQYPSGLPFEDFIINEAKAFGLEQDALEMLMGYARGCAHLSGENALKSLEEELALSDPADEYDIKADKVCLMTLHSAKGLEFPTVFIAGTEDGLVPFSAKDADTEEERRLFYVGLTRAKESLYLTHALKRRTPGKEVEPRQSRFIPEMGEGLFVVEKKEKKKAVRRPVQKALFE